MASTGDGQGHRRGTDLVVSHGFCRSDDLGDKRPQAENDLLTGGLPQWNDLDRREHQVFQPAPQPATGGALGIDAPALAGKTVSGDMRLPQDQLILIGRGFQRLQQAVKSLMSPKKYPKKFQRIISGRFCNPGRPVATFAPLSIRFGVGLESLPSVKNSPRFISGRKLCALLFLFTRSARETDFIDANSIHLPAWPPAATSREMLRYADGR